MLNLQKVIKIYKIIIFSKKSNLLDDVLLEFDPPVEKKRKLESNTESDGLFSKWLWT